MTQPADIEIINLLVDRDGIPTLVTLKGGRGLTVHNIAWGYDDGDEYAHVTTNISPSLDGASIDYFLTNDIEAVTDPKSGDPLA